MKQQFVRLELGATVKQTMTSTRNFLLRFQKVFYSFGAWRTRPWYLHDAMHCPMKYV